MTRQEQLDAIRKACIRANPEIIIPIYEGARHFVDRGPIRLADVLLAIEAKMSKSGDVVVVGSSGNIGVWYEDRTPEFHWTERCEWNLRKDDLTEQSDECVAFLSDLLA